MEKKKKPKRLKIEKKLGVEGEREEGRGKGEEEKRGVRRVREGEEGKRKA